VISSFCSSDKRLTRGGGVFGWVVRLVRVVVFGFVERLRVDLLRVDFLRVVVLRDRVLFPRVVVLLRRVVLGFERLEVDFLRVVRLRAAIFVL
jgi:hypothetical protein